MPIANLLQQLQSHLTELGVIDLLCDLIRAPSYIGLPRHEEQTVAVLTKYFAQTLLQSKRPTNSRLPLFVLGFSPKFWT